MYDPMDALYSVLAVITCVFCAELSQSWFQGLYLCIGGLYFILSSYLLDRKLQASFHSALTDHTGSGKSLLKFASSLRDIEDNGLWILCLPLIARFGSAEDRDLILSSNLPGFLLTILHPLLTGTIHKLRNRKLLSFTLLCSFFLGFCYGTIAWHDHFLPNSSIFYSAIASGLSMVVSYPAWIILVLLSPGSFTVGEAGVLCQCVFLAVVKFTFGSFVESSFPLEIVLTIRAALFATLWLLLSTVTFRKCRVVPFLCYANLILTVSIAIWTVSKQCGKNLLLFGLEYLVEGGKTRWCVLLFWSLCLCASVIFVGVAQSVSRLGTAHRKFFHLAVGLVCASGLQLDPELTVLASCILLSGFIIIEIIRNIRLHPFGPILESSYSAFLDSQDRGPLVLTPIYLLISAFIPLWLSPVNRVSGVWLKHYAGIISVGFGDSFASLTGSSFGKRFWFAGSKKTIEGTVGGIVAQIVGIALVCYLVRMPVQSFLANFWPLMFVAATLGCLETFTKQIDNLVLPFSSYVLLSLFD